MTGHMRTVPDGLIDNNITGGVPGKVNPEQIYISTYRRTLPDGIVSNNLSTSSHPLNPSFVPDAIARNGITAPQSARSISFTSGFVSLIMSLDLALRSDVSQREKRNQLTRALWCWIPTARRQLP